MNDVNQPVQLAEGVYKSLGDCTAADLEQAVLFLTAELRRETGYSCHPDCACAECEEDAELERRIEQRCRELEAEGWRIVDGGQLGPYDENHECPWEVTDYRTGEVLISGHTTFEECDRIIDTEMNGRWHHIDRIEHQVFDAMMAEGLLS